MREAMSDIEKNSERARRTPENSDMLPRTQVHVLMSLLKGNLVAAS